MNDGIAAKWQNNCFATRSRALGDPLMNKFSTLFCILLFGIGLSGCTGFAQIDKPEQEIVDRKYRFNGIDLSVSDEARALLKKNKLIRIPLLTRIIRKVLAKEQLLDKNSPYRLKIRITWLKSRSNAIAIILPVSWSDHLYGTVSVVDKQQHVVEKFKVKAKYSLGGTLSGHSAIRLRLLYYNFAKTTANTFTGKDDNE